jgi:hypothetical protein
LSTSIIIIVSLSTKSPAFLVALSIAVILDPCSLAAFSKKALKT